MAENSFRDPKVIMAWSTCLIEIGKTKDDDTFADDPLNDIGIVKYQSTTLETSEGDQLKAQETGGGVVAQEDMEGGYTLNTRIIEPSNAFFEFLGLGTNVADSANGEFRIKTHIVAGDYSVKVTPKNIGARGIMAPKTHISFKPGYSEEEGNYLDLSFEILQGNAGYWYSRFTKKAEPILTVTPNSLSFGKGEDTKGQVINVTANNPITATSSANWIHAAADDKADTVTVTVDANTAAERNGNVTVVAGGLTLQVAVTQADGTPAGT